MKLRKGVDPVQFLKQVNLCSDEVLFCTQEGDVINLKSKLSQMVFAVAAADEEMLEMASIVCKNKEDEKVLGEFINKGSN